MRTISVSARYDGRQIWLDESVELKPDTQLLVTILEGDDNPDRPSETASVTAHHSLTFAFDDQQDDYPVHLIK